jgi:hypothetical protein
VDSERSLAGWAGGGVTWAKFDDRYDDNRKVKKAWRLDPASVGLHAMAITYSSRHETDGIIDLDWLTEKLPNARGREKTIAALVESELLEPIDGDRFRVHDYLDFNPSSEQLAEKRRKDAERKRERQSRGIQPESERNPAGIHAESERPVRVVRTGSVHPVPSRPGPSL